MRQVLGADTHRVDDHGIVCVDAEQTDLKQVAVMGRADAHREIFVQMPLCDGVASRVEHVVVLMPCFRAVCAMRTK
jgi:hypothetical protein